MERRALETYVARARGILEESPPASAAATWTWLVRPLLSALGWNVDSDRCERSRAVRGVELAAVLSVEIEVETPAMFVAVEGSADSLNADRTDRLRRVMAETGVDRAMYTNGRRFVLLAGPRGADRLAFELDALVHHEDALAHFSADAIEDRLAENAPELGVRRLAVGRDALAATLADEIGSVAGSFAADELLEETTSFLDDLVESRAGGRPEELAEWRRTATEPRRAVERTDDGAAPGSGAESAIEDDSEREGDPEREANSRRKAISRGDLNSSRTENSTRASSSNRERNRPRRSPPAGRTKSATDTDSSGVGARSDESARPERSGDGEYVVRFFNERGSIGGVGHSDPAEAMVSAIEFCFERGLSGIRLPWHPSDGDEYVLNDDPVCADGESMTAYKQLSNGLYVNTAGPPDELAARVSALASSIGLRTMVRGDWSVDG